jgi:hypothetical protein
LVETFSCYWHIISNIFTVALYSETGFRFQIPKISLFNNSLNGINIL